MLSFKNHIKEAKAYGLEPKAGDEKNFKDKHVVDVRDEPHNDAETLKGTKKSPAKKKRLADMDLDQAEKVYEEKMMKCEDCGEEYDADEGEHECEMDEETMTDSEVKKREEIVKGMKKNEDDLKKRYGDRWRSVMYATATKKAMEEAWSSGGSSSVKAKYNKDAVDQAIKKDPRIKGKEAKAIHALLKGRTAKKEEVELDELKKSTIGSYIKKANINTADAADQNASKGRNDKSSIGKVLKRFKGVSTAADKLTGKAKVPATEEVQIDEISAAKAIRTAVKRETGAYTKAIAHGDEPSQREYDKIAANKRRIQKKYGSKAANIADRTAGRRIGYQEEVELDERNKANALKKKNLDTMRGARFKLDNPNMVPKRDEKKHKTGQQHNKAIGRALRQMEEFDLDEAFKVGAMKLKDGSSVKLAKEDVQALEGLYKNLNSSNRKKMQEKLEADKKSFGEILAFAKQAM